MTYVRFRISEGGVCTIKMVEYSYIHNQIKPPPPFHGKVQTKNRTLY